VRLGFGVGPVRHFVLPEYRLSFQSFCLCYVSVWTSYS